MSHIGERIRKRRIQCEMSQQELANKMGYKSKTTITKIENGDNDVIQSNVIRFAKILNTTPAYLMGLVETPTAQSNDDLPLNAILPSAKSIPIMGTICAGDGVVCEDEYMGNFVMDTGLKADYCLRVRGDSMQEVNIFDGDIVFIKQDCNVENGKIYAVENLDTHEASLKKVTLQQENVILTPCNPDYSPIVTDYSEIRIVGECVGVLHKY